MNSDSLDISELADEIRDPWRPSDERNLPYIALEHIEQETLSLNSIGDLQEVASQGWRFQPSDVLFGKMRPYFRKVVAPRMTGVCSGEIAVIRAKRDSDINFLFYALANPKFIEFATVNSKGDRPRTKWEHFSRFPIKKFSPSQRQLIGDTLRNYDNLIENNRRRITLLEEAARQLYQEWFVRLRFPGHEQTKIVDGVPEGWERRSIKSLSSFLSRGITPEYDEDAEGLVINQKCIRNSRVDLSLARRQRKEFKSDRQVQIGDVLVNSTGEGTLGRVAQIHEYVSNCTVDTHVTIVRPAEHHFVHFIGLSLTSRETLLATMGRGATNQTELSRDDIGKVEVVVPSDDILKKFEDFAAPIFKQRCCLVNQIEKLRQARDLLLPRLMSGEITI